MTRQTDILRIFSSLAAAAATAAVLTGCGYVDRGLAVATGYSTICVKESGVKYIQFASGAAPMIDRAGKPVPCN